MKKGFVITDGFGYATTNQIEGWHFTTLLNVAIVWPHREHAQQVLAGTFRGNGCHIREVELDSKGRAIRKLP